MLPYLALIVISLFLYFKLFKRPKQHLSNVSEKYILITGCDSGFGRQTAIRLDSLGFPVIATCLTDEGEQSLRSCCTQRLHVLHVDVTDHSQVQAAYEHVNKIIANTEAGSLWSVINNAGIVHVAPVDWQTIDDMKRVVDVNLWGLIDVTKTFLPLLKKSKGRLINIASAQGRLSLPYIAIYCGSKFAVEGFSDALRRELCQWRVKVILIEPGFHATGITAEKMVAANWDKIWSELSEEKKVEYGEEFFRKSKEISLTFVQPNKISDKIDDVVDAIVDGVTSHSPKLRYVVGLDANFLWVWLARLPTWVADWVLINWITKIQVPAQVKNEG